MAIYIRDVVNRLPNEFRYADLERALPAVSRPTIARALRELTAEGLEPVRKQK
jgi:DNA-binding HxlR family transcriptional regulator